MATLGVGLIGTGFMGEGHALACRNVEAAMGAADMPAPHLALLCDTRLYHNGGPVAEQGFTTILTGPAHSPDGSFIPAPSRGGRGPHPISPRGWRSSG